MIAFSRYVRKLAFLAAVVGLLSTPLACSAAQLLLNPSFEAGVPLWNGDSCGGEAAVGGWTYSTIMPPPDPQYCLGFWNGAVTDWGGGTSVRTGAHSVRAFHYGGWDVTPQHPAGWRYATIRQEAPCIANQQYTGSAWIYAWNDGAPAEPSGFYYGLRVEELDAGSSVVATHEDLYTSPVPTWREAKVQFTTTAQTATLRYLLVMYWYQNSNHSHIDFDDCTLTGPDPNAKLIQGVVTAGGSPLSGAEVSADGVSTTSAANGSYTLEMAGAITDVTIRASKDGYFAQRKYRTLTSQSTNVDFDLVAVGSNLLTNAGFDDNASHDQAAAPTGWNLQQGEIVRESFFLEAAYTNYIRSGEEAAGLISDTVPAEVVLTHGLVSILPNQQYTAKAWIRAAGEGTMWYSGSTQKAALRIQQLDAGGSQLAEHYAYVTNFSDWQQVSHTFTSEPGAAMVRISCWANMAERYSDTLARAVFDDVELNGPGGGPLPPFFGKVVSGVTPLQDAYVHLPFNPPNETWTDAAGVWSLSPTLLPAAYWVRAVKPGYYTQRFVRSAPSLEAVIFDLVAKGNNLIVNAGFDDEWNAGGWVEEASGQGPTYARGEYFFIAGQTGTRTFYYSGDDAVGLFASDGAPGGMWYNQTHAVLGSTQYTAAVKFRPGVADGFPTSYNNPLDDQVAGLKIQELNSSGVLVKEHPLVQAQETGDWEPLSTAFTTEATTRFIKIGPYVWQNTDARPNGWDRGVFDDVELNGPAGAYGLSGTVTSGGLPVAGVIVAVTEQDGATSYYPTNASGQYTATVNYGSVYSLTASKGGYYPALRSVTITGEKVVDFELVAVGDNLLLNPGFDDTAGWLSGGWMASGFIAPETNTALYGAAHYYTPPQATYARGPGLESRVYQDVAVLPNTNYTATCWFRPGTDTRYGSVWGVNLDQKGALFVQFLDASKNIIGTELRDEAEVTTGNLQQWQQLSLSTGPTPANVAFIRVGGWAYMVDNYDGNLARALFDQFALNGPQGASKSVSEVKEQADGTTAQMGGKIVSSAFPDFFYIQEEDRSSGIRVSGLANPGDRVDVFGTLTTVDGERQIINTNVVQRTTGSVPAPLGINNRSVNVGLSPVGLYMTMWGRVDGVEGAQGFFTMTDGAGDSIKVYGSATLNDYVVVNGPLGAEDPGTGPVPVLRAVQVTKGD